MDLLAADASARVDPSKRMLSGLSSGLKRRRRWRLASAACAVMVASFIVFTLAAPKHDEGLAVVIDDEQVPVVPLESWGAPAIAPVASFDVDESFVPVVHRVSPVFSKAAARRVVTGKRRPRAPEAAPLDVAVLSVLVEHIDSERRAGRGKPRNRE